MFGWFTEQASTPNKHASGTHESTAPNFQRSMALSQVESLSATHRDQPHGPELRRTMTSAVMKPHDAVLAELQGQLHDLETVDQVHSASSQTADQQPPEASAAADSNSNIAYDPFTGAVMGVFSPIQNEDTRDEMWGHLTKIRELQAEIAGMHLQMEGLGNIERAARVERTGDDGEPENADEARAAKEADFTRLTDRFIGRKDATDAIMAKLDTLSEAVATFHSLGAPAQTFESSRSDSIDENTNLPGPAASATPSVDVQSSASTAVQPTFSLSEKNAEAVADLETPKASMLG